ncbi:Retrovirus-related Pol polyprotein from transposon opus, partial [Dictyocoela muelleri]
MTTTNHQDKHFQRYDRSSKSIKQFSKSLFTLHLRGTDLQSGYRNLSSKSYHPKKILNDIKEEQRRLTNIFKVDEQFETATFEVTSAISGLRFTHKINLLKSIADQYVHHWIDVFRETARICNWNQDIQFDVLKQLVDVTIHILIGECSSAEEILFKILKTKYNYQTSFIYHNKLSHIKQFNFYTIHAYYNEIKNVSYRLGACLDWNRNMIEEKIKETFLNNLDYEAKLELTRFPTADIPNIITQITTVENIIIENLSLSLTLEYESKPSNNYQPNKNTYRPIKNHKDAKEVKFCSFHKTHTHNDTECRAINKRKRCEETSRDKTLIVQETSPKIKNIEVDIKIKEKTYNAILDTGSSENCIPEKICTELDIRTNKLNQVRTIELANGTSEEIKYDAKIEFSLFNDNHNKYISNFLILPKTASTIILGMKFLCENRAKIDLEQQILIIDGRDYEIGTENEFSYNPDNKLADNTKILMTKQLEDKIKEMINIAIQHNPEIGRIDPVKHSITLKGEFTNKIKEYPVPINMRAEVQNHLNELINNKIIRRQHSDYISPAFILKKSNGQLRLVVDYRALNKNTVKTTHFLPKVSEILSNMAGAKCFSKIDLNKGYYQIEMKKEDIPKTGFRILNQCFVFTRMPFGLCNAPRTFQENMEIILETLDFVYIYLDDILIFSKSYEDHFEHLKIVFERLKRHNVSINFNKSEFAKIEITFLGNIISPKGMRADISKIENFKINTPKNKRELQRMLGLINWFRPYIPNLSLNLGEFYKKLVKSNAKFIWTEDDEKRLQEIFKHIKENSTLFHPNFNEPFIINTDASEEGIGGVVTQDDKIIGYYSYLFNKSERNYTIVEKELLAIIKTIDHFKSILFNSKLIINCDNKNLIFNGPISKRINRWKILLEEYDYDLKHIIGEKNVLADYLSRNSICKLLKSTSNTPECYNDYPLLTLPRIENSEYSQIVPLLTKIHIDMIHPGQTKMINTLKKYINIRGMKKMIKIVCENCQKCQQEKIFNKQYGQTYPTFIPQEIGETIGMDLKGPINSIHFKTTKPSEFYICTFVDLFSRYTEIAILWDISTFSICKALDKILQKMKKPKKILTDQGRQFISSKFKDHLKKLDIQHIMTSPYNPTGNSIVERINLEIGLCLRLTRGESIKKLKEKIWIRLNLLNNRNLGYSPYEIYHNSSIFQNNKIEIKINNEILKRKLGKIQKENIKKSNEKRIKVKYSEGQDILLKNFSQDKVIKKWNGPYKFIRIKNGENSAVIDKGNKKVTVSIKNIRPFKRGVDVETSEVSTNAVMKGEVYKNLEAGLE